MNKIILLPLYLQKYIIKIICKFINSQNKILDLPFSFSDYRNNESQVKKITILIASVCKDWLYCLSNNLNVSCDFNYSDTKYSIIKSPNIKTLKLHFNHTEKVFYKYRIKSDENDKDEHLINEYVNEKLESLSSGGSGDFKKLIIRNVENFQNVSEIQQLLGRLGGVKFKETIKKISLLSLHLNGTSTLAPQLKSVLDGKVCQVFSVTISYIVGPSVRNELIETLRIWGNSIKQIDIDINQDFETIHRPYNTLENFLNLSLPLSSDTLNLSNIEYLNIIGQTVTFKDLQFIFTSTKKLKLLSLHNFCFKSFSFYLSTDQERSIGDSSGGSGVSGPLPKLCKCKSIIDHTEINVTQGPLQLNADWNTLLNILNEQRLVNTSSSTLTQLEISNSCGFRESSYNGQFPKSVLPKFIQFLKSFPILDKLILGNIKTPDIFEEISENIKTITKFSSFVIECDSDAYIESLKRILSKNQHITHFKLVQLTSNDQNYYGEVLLFEHNK